VRIFGYPAISGGYSLTITDGIISSFPGGGEIVTSAKISRGNSGGLAVDKYGCMIGVPTLVSSDENESLGIIYSMSLVNEFTSEVSKYLDKK
jgi:S1-C subfamily serine protease